ncbi:MAG: hypothetical protein MUF06_21185 [Pirellulaceae bacterium]|nr:hypothetical protein [Pirellulaceae bacterium]
MKHHFGDLLDREGDYWTIVPNADRYAHQIDAVPAGSPEIVVATIGARDAAWRNIFTFPNLEELTLHEPSPEQWVAIAELSHLKRLRLTHARPKNLDFLPALANLEELVLEYVSGFSDLAPLRSLARLRSLHLENLRRVHDFGGLAGIESLRYLSIQGTLDWKQPVDDFEFIRGLPNLEFLELWQFACKAPFPAALPLVGLKKLKRLKLTWNMLPTEEYALLEVGLPGVAGARWGPYTQFPYSGNEQWFEFTGKGAGRAKCGLASSDRKCADFTQKYELLKQQAAKVLAAERR